MVKILNWCANRIPTWVRRGSAAIGPIGALAALIIGVKELFSLSGPGWAIVLAISAGLLVFISIVSIYLEQYRHQIELENYRRNSRVAVSLTSLHDAFDALRDASVVIRADDSTDSQIRVLVKSLESMNLAFSAITGVPCRMCVKELIAGSDAPEEITLNTGSDERWLSVRTWYRHDGHTDPVKDAPSPLYKNTDFARVLDQTAGMRCFFSNDLDNETGYRNEHRDGAVGPHQYDYNSTIVWPIQRKRSDGTVLLIGYLCVDSLQTNVFQYNNDFYLGAAYADSLYTVLTLMNDNPPRDLSRASVRDGENLLEPTPEEQP